MNGRLRRAAITALVSLPLCAAVTMQSVALAGPKADAMRADWTSFGGDSDEQHYSPLAQINSGNVGKLGLAWYYDIDTFDSYTQPLEVNGVV